MLELIKIFISCCILNWFGNKIILELNERHMHINCVNENGLLKCKTENKTYLCAFSLAALRSSIELLPPTVEHREDEILVRLLNSWPLLHVACMYGPLYTYTHCKRRPQALLLWYMHGPEIAGYNFF